MNFGREKLTWGQDLWARIDQAVSYEAERTKVAAKFLPWKGPLPEALTVPADIIELKPEVLSVDEGSVTAIIELWVEFALTQGQIEDEEHMSTAVTLATRATNILSQAEDLLIFQG